MILTTYSHPDSLILYNIFPLQLQTATVGSLLALMVLSCFGEVARRFVGFVYYHPERREVKVAHLTFWGSRQDTVVPLESVIPVSETTESPRSLVWAVHFYDEHLGRKLICTRLGGIKNRSYFAEIFGYEALEGVLDGEWREGDDDRGE